MLLKNIKLLCAAVFAAGAMALNAAVPSMVLEYDYNDNGSISSRTINGAVQKFEYDKRGQLLSVKDKSGNFVERYAYDKAGNILEKEINGKLTKFTYDKANQLVTKTDPSGKVTNYSYDASGRLVKEGDKEYKYSYLDKLVEVTENGKPVANFDYYVDGQIATATQNGVTENFVWDGLALVARNTASYVNEPAVTGGNPILANNKVLFNDMLGSTLGVKDGSKMTQVAMTSFGETSSNEAFFTGKPMIGELGYAFLFRNYRADNGKWQTADPIALASNTPQQYHIHNDLASSLGYPDGLNSMAYCNNNVTSVNDPLGLIGIGGTVISDDIEYTLDHFDYVGSYALIVTYTLNAAGDRLTEYISNNSFDVFRPVYTWRCLRTGCRAAVKTGDVNGNALVATSAYTDYNTAIGLSVPITSLGAPNAVNVPASPSGYYYAVTGGTHTPPTSTNVAPGVGHVHE